MVRIIDYKQRQSEEGDMFFSLEVQGDVELVESKIGNLYFTMRKTSIMSTFDEDTCKSLIGRELPGSIIKEDCEPYEYTIKESNEVVELNYTYTYIPDME